ncbi:DUF2804 family protein [Conexibacter sp. W3-3-2]|uniref:DUF2804 family protein n=1 Tax=Conexibacter sp. W3-3-2 TaxID=2675227 RepID=UPI0012B8332D|nr:DUF2804 family protein [Conexibacter sp. W3-3-2]MTD44191.1 DUF2804 family protein [Conexibacter sp. W3-3-2]
MPPVPPARIVLPAGDAAAGRGRDALAAGVAAGLLPPARMPLVHDRRPLKRWRYVGVYGPELMLCAGRVVLGGAPQAFWAVWDREAQQLHERTSFSPTRVRLPDGGVGVRDRGVEIDLRIDRDGDAVETVSRHGRSHIWTRKQGAAARGTVTIDGRTRHLVGRALIDDSAGYHARTTDWEWAAGIGATADGVALTWNLVTGIHDAPTGSERTVWADGVATEVGPVRFAADLATVAFAEGDELRFHAEAERTRRDRVGPFVSSDYRQPFGSVSGTLPGGHVLAAGFGVMERHHARW